MSTIKDTIDRKRWEIHVATKAWLHAQPAEDTAEPVDANDAREGAVRSGDRRESDRSGDPSPTPRTDA